MWVYIEDPEIKDAILEEFINVLKEECVIKAAKEAKKKFNIMITKNRLEEVELDFLSQQIDWDKLFE